MPISKRKAGERNVRETRDYVPDSQSGSSSQLTGWVIAIGVVLAMLIIFIFAKFNTMVGGTNIQDLERKIEKLEGKISKSENNERIIVNVMYEGGSSISNNVSWIGERSLGYPPEAKGKICYIIGDKIRGEGGGSIGGRIGIAGNSGRYTYSTMYEADLNNVEDKIEITKNGGYSNSNLTNTERNNLYLAFTMLCY